MNLNYWFCSNDQLCVAANSAFDFFVFGSCVSSLGGTPPESFGINFSIAWSTLKLAALALGGNSWKLLRNSPTIACAGTSKNVRSAIHFPKNTVASSDALSNGSDLRLNM